MEPASNQLEAGSTMDLDPSDKEAMESSEEDYKDPEPEPMWIGRITDKPTLVGEPDNYSGKGVLWYSGTPIHFPGHVTPSMRYPCNPALFLSAIHATSLG